MDIETSIALTTERLREQAAAEELAKVAMRELLKENPGPWKHRVFEARVAESTGVWPDRIRGALWSLVGEGELYPGFDGLYDTSALDFDVSKLN